MASRNDYIASIDIGTDKIAVLVAEKVDDDKIAYYWTQYLYHPMALGRAQFLPLIHFLGQSQRL